MTVSAPIHTSSLSVVWLQYPCTADDYDILQEIGVGAFATVYRATVNATGVSNATNRQTHSVGSRWRAATHRSLCMAPHCVSQEEVAIKIIDLEQFNTNWDEIRVSTATLNTVHVASLPDGTF